MMKTRIIAAIGCLALAASTYSALAEDTAAPYKANWESLAAHNEAPEWFQDVKFGIYFHWGVYSVPAYGSEWYPRNMHIKSNDVYKHHVEKYGDPSEYGYDKFVPQFKAEKFDAEAWADLFQKAGARFAGPVAEHHDGFAMWASKLTPWNAAERGPKRDLTGELEKAIRARGMKFFTSFHHARNSLWEKDGNWTGHYEYAKKDFPEVLEDPERAILYGYMPREDFLQMWKGKLLEVIDAYQPDIIWFDSWLDQIPDEQKMEFLAYYFNQAQKAGKEVVVTCKQEDIRRDVAVEDFEKGRADHLTDYVWLTDDTISRGSWCYTDNLTIKPTSEVLHSFIDIVSKNGVLVLNISPMADGTIPENQQQVLLEMGEWLGVCGDAIYDTRPWSVFGEGPTRMGKGGAFIRFRGEYSGRDVRFTQSKDGKKVYATTLGWPGTELRLNSVQVDKADEDAQVTMLGYDKPLKYELTDDQRLVIAVPDLAEDQRPCQFAYSFCLSGFELSVSPIASFEGDTAISLPAAKALLEGERIDIESKNDGRDNIGFWDSPEERIHWLVHIREAGKYMVRGEFARAAEGGDLTAEVNGQSLSIPVPVTGGWNNPQMIDAGRIEFDKPGVYHLILRPADAANWKAVNVWQLQLARVK